MTVMITNDDGVGAPGIGAPNCPGGKIRGLLETALAPACTPDLVASTSNCSSTETTFPRDAAACNQGYATLTEVPVPPG